MKAKDFRNRAWNLLKEDSKYWMLLVTILIAVIVVLATNILSLLIIGTLLVGLNAIYLKAYRDNEVQISLFLDVAKKGFVNTLVAHLLELVFTFLWSLLFIIPGIIKSHAYAMTKFILADNPEMEGMDALKASEKMMDGNKWRLFCLRFSFIGWFILGILTLGIGLIFLHPYVLAAETAFYLDLLEEVPIKEAEYSENKIEYI